MKITLEHIKETVDSQRTYLRNTYNVQNIGVFGSVARRDNTDDSDIDVLVTFAKPLGMFKFIELEDYLGTLLGKRVDLVTKRALKPAMKDDVLQEVVYV
jgi:predicted nucleotidyltransferase